MHKYDDIIHLPHPEPKTHPRMAKGNRAAQFSPFAALTGYDEAVCEEARLTDAKRELSEDMIEALNERFAVIERHIKERPYVTVTYFLQDEKKNGGRYVEASGHVKKLDGTARVILLEDDTRIPIEDVRSVEGELLRRFEG